MKCLETFCLSFSTVATVGMLECAVSASYSLYRTINIEKAICLQLPLLHFNLTICQPLEKGRYSTYLTVPVLDAGEKSTSTNAVLPYQTAVCVNHSSSSILTQLR
jgi:hypothetical protein